MKWEASKQYNVGLDARFLRQRLSLTLDGYIRKHEDWLVTAPIRLLQVLAVLSSMVSMKNQDIVNSWNDNLEEISLTV